MLLGLLDKFDFKRKFREEDERDFVSKLTPRLLLYNSRVEASNEFLSNFVKELHSLSAD